MNANQNRGGTHEVNFQNSTVHPAGRLRAACLLLFIFLVSALAGCGIAYAQNITTGSSVEVMAGPGPLVPSTLDWLLNFLPGAWQKWFALLGVATPFLGLIYHKVEPAFERLALWIISTPDTSDDALLQRFMQSWLYRIPQALLAACNLPVLPTWEALVARAKQTPFSNP